MAEKLGMPWSTYTRYESPAEYKKPHLPVELTRRVARILADYGVPQAEVMQLAGLDEGEVNPVGLTTGEQLLLDTFQDLDPDQRELLQELANQMRAARPSEPPQDRRASATVHSGRRDFRPERKEHA